MHKKPVVTLKRSRQSLGGGRGGESGRLTDSAPNTPGEHLWRGFTADAVESPFGHEWCIGSDMLCCMLWDHELLFSCGKVRAHLVYGIGHHDTFFSCRVLHLSLLLTLNCSGGVHGKCSSAQCSGYHSSSFVHVKHKDIKLQDQRPAEWVSDVLCPLVAMSRNTLFFFFLKKKNINCHIGVCVRRVHMKVSRRRLLHTPT